LVMCSSPVPPGNELTAPTFGEDLEFLRKHTEVVVLGDDRARVAVVPEYQGRVMTSTSAGAAGPSFGWINRDAVSTEEFQRHINAFGGEDRFWLGPEGGQFSIFFPQGAPFEFENWQTPAPIDWGSWEVISKEADAISFRRDMQLVNYSGTELKLRVDRVIRMLPRSRVADLLGAGIPEEIELVAFESENQITNTGDKEWSKSTGLLSIWILGMFQPSEQATVIIPFEPGTEAERGRIVNDAYFGKVSTERLRVEEERLFFRADGKSRGKIGIGPSRAKPLAGSFDAENQVLTLVQFNLPETPADYVNSMWEIQEHPYSGDVVNSYNDGPVSPGADPLGPFYELETSSPASELGPAGSVVHIHRTVHARGPEILLSDLSKQTLGVSLEDVGQAFKR